MFIFQPIQVQSKETFVLMFYVLIIFINMFSTASLQLLILTLICRVCVCRKIAIEANVIYYIWPVSPGTPGIGI